MESNAVPGGLYSNRNPEMMGLEISLNHHIPNLQQNPSHKPLSQHPMMSYGHNEVDYPPQAHKSLKQGNLFGVKSKSQSLTLSDDDEPGLTADNSADDGKKKMSPWHRMKWTDDMVRLLILVVFYIGDEVGSEGTDLAVKKKSGGVLQKKGKWKSVSRALMERGFYVSPQQCEDKFNDLNKRYKRVNDILGKGTACQVVENQSLLDKMDHLTPKTKEEVKKLLNSKHLFFREMCAYHNSCGHGGSSNRNGIENGTATGDEVQQELPQSHLHHPFQQQRCLHSSENIPAMPNLNTGAKKVVVGEDEDEEDDENSEEEGEDEDDDMMAGGSNNEIDERTRKRERKGMSHLSMVQQLDYELTNLLQDGMKSPFEKRNWMKSKLMQLDEHSVGIQYQSLVLEKQRLKWLKFSSKKEREMNREKLINEQMKLENERMVYLIRQKELDFVDNLQHSSNWKSDPSSIYH